MPFPLPKGMGISCFLGKAIYIIQKPQNEVKEILTISLSRIHNGLAFERYPVSARLHAVGAVCNRAAPPLSGILFLRGS